MCLELGFAGRHFQQKLARQHLWCTRRKYKCFPCALVQHSSCLDLRTFCRVPITLHPAGLLWTRWGMPFAYILWLWSCGFYWYLAETWEASSNLVKVLLLMLSLCNYAVWWCLCYNHTHSGELGQMYFKWKIGSSVQIIPVELADSLHHTNHTTLKKSISVMQVIAEVFWQSLGMDEWFAWLQAM